VLGLRGIGLAALNAEAGTQESAAAGFFYAMQLFLPPAKSGSPGGPSLPGKVLGVIPVDPVESMLQGMAGRKLERRADLLAVAISLSNSGAVNLCFVPMEVSDVVLAARTQCVILKQGAARDHGRSLSDGRA
jgi:hypothetical protein